ncbi:MAG: oxidoreductase [Armatimonadetes bacterium]|nr:oxidoreductase [Armatimonadota bacterium]NIO74598.1 oxidoreductase [Armatimonadota bacterium]NIO96553.1 oxidoreductase [Armatimonadota bacterium]
MTESTVSSVLPALVFLFPAAAGLLAWSLGKIRAALAETLAVLGAIGALVFALAMVPPVLAGHALTCWGVELRVDGLGCLATVLLSALGLTAGIFSIRYMHHRRFFDASGADITHRRLPAFYGLFLFCLAAILWGTTTNNIIMLYVAVEATTIASGLLVAFWWDRRALEASYKYLMLLTVGITFALFGCVLLYSASTNYLSGVNALLMSKISTIADQLPRSIVVFVTALFIIGFGTKAGVAPFHPWLPDAYAESPSPISALLSGVKAKMAAYALARTLAIFFPAYGALGLFIVILAAFTMLLGGLMALAQQDVKRLLAYSSVSQMGYILMGLGFWSYLGAYGALFHIINHALCKALLFLAIGAVIYRTAGRNFDQLGGLGAKMPATAVCFFIGAFAISGLPPFNGFVSKLTIFLAGAQAGMWWAAAIAIFTSLLTMVAVVKAGYLIFWAKPKDEAILERAKEAPASMLVPVAALSFGCIFLGIWPQTIFPLLHRAVTSLGLAG